VAHEVGDHVSIRDILSMKGGEKLSIIEHEKIIFHEVIMRGKMEVIMIAIREHEHHC